MPQSIDYWIWCWGETLLEILMFVSKLRYLVITSHDLMTFDDIEYAFQKTFLPSLSMLGP